MEGKIESTLKGYAKLRPLRFHMPGHKAEKEFCKHFPGAAYDITELGFSDSLQHPEGIIREAEDEVRDVLGAKKTYFLTDGSTCGVLSMLYAAREFGRKIIVNRNAHQSVFNACKLFGIEPVILNQNVKNGVMMPPTADELEKTLDDTPEAIGFLLTYPDYYGLTFDIARAKELTASRNKLLLIDGAHGAHLRFAAMPPYAGDFADIWVDGVHKTLPCLTQAALLNVGNKGLIAKVTNAVNMFRTTSPSYAIMSSIEYGEKFMAENGRELLSKLRVEVAALRTRLEAKGYACLKDADSLKLAVDFKPVGISTYKAEKILNKHNVFAEMNDGRYLLFLFGPTTDKRSLDVLESRLKKLVSREDLKNTFAARADVRFGVRKMPYLTANVNSRKESVDLKESAGKILAENVGVFPPCFPLCMAGEVMTEEIIAILSEAKNTFGIINNKVKVVKEQADK
ncbi:MAG: aminotransferase class I/II-fold pyridoxal phosphate-dependent enzyme [Eubacteriales bacterium]